MGHRGIHACFMSMVSRAVFPFNSWPVLRFPGYAGSIWVNALEKGSRQTAFASLTYYIDKIHLSRQLDSDIREEKQGEAPSSMVKDKK